MRSINQYLLESSENLCKRSRILIMVGLGLDLIVVVCFVFGGFPDGGAVVLIFAFSPVLLVGLYGLVESETNRVKYAKRLEKS